MPLATVRSCAPSGVDAPPVLVEVHLGGGLPGMAIVGLPWSAVRESKDRVKAAIRHAGFRHNLPFCGPPGTGKSMPASRLAGILYPSNRRFSCSTSRSSPSTARPPRGSASS